MSWCVRAQAQQGFSQFSQPLQGGGGGQGAPPPPPPLQGLQQGGLVSSGFSDAGPRSMVSNLQVRDC